MEIDNRNVDREEERTTERKKDESRQSLERKMKYEPMKTFEAKLSEKSAHEMSSKDSLLRDAHNLKKSKDEKESIFNKIMGVVKDGDGEGEKDKAKVASVHEQVEHEFEDSKTNELVESEFEIKEDDDKTENTEKADKKDGEISDEGHKRVAEKNEGDGAGGFGGGSQGQSGGGDSGQGGFHSGTGNQSQDDAVNFSDPAIVAGKVSGIRKQSGTGMGFQGNARNFSQKNLDEIVSSVQLGLNSSGEEEFTVELNDEYFNGLTVMATRTAEGVVLKFKCPNVEVRSTFLRFRPKVYAQFKAKSISVKRIEVV